MSQCSTSVFFVALLVLVLAEDAGLLGYRLAIGLAGLCVIAMQALATRHARQRPQGEETRV